jgi:ribose transport system permease protein
LNSAQPALGAGYELDAIAAVVIGGTSLSGGEGTILGTIIGAFIMSTLTNGLRILSVAQEWQMVVTGGIVIVAVYADTLRRRRQQSRMFFEGGDQGTLQPPGQERGQRADASAGS